MPDLVAIAPGSDWAFIRVNNKLVVIRPPYRSWSQMDATESMVEEAITRHGFVHSEQNFQDLKALIDHLKQGQAAIWKERHQEGFTGVEIERLVHQLPAERLVRFLDKAENDFIPKKKWDAAEELLAALLDVKVVRQDDVLNRRILTLLRSCIQARNMAEKHAQDALNSDENPEYYNQHFPNIPNPEKFRKFVEKRSSLMRPF